MYNMIRKSRIENMDQKFLDIACKEAEKSS